MATTKKTSTPKKSSKITVKKNAKNSPRAWSWRFSILTVGIYAIVVSTLIVGAFATANYIHTQQDNTRLDRIKAIYASIDVPDSYQVERYNVFGDKRPYEWDAGRTYSSEISYAHGDTVSNTFADLDKRIKDAGFTFVDEPYPGSVSKQYHYKSDKGEYVRMTVSSKPYDDAWRNYALLKQTMPDDVLDAFDTNAGPSNVTIKVNLDDNNE
jgi:hypothetical protein